MGRGAEFAGGLARFQLEQRAEMLGVREARFGRDLHQRQIGFREQFFHTIELHAKDFGFRRASEVFVEAA